MNKNLFSNKIESLIFDHISQYISQYNNPPSAETVKVILTGISNISQSDYDQTVQLLDELDSDESEQDPKWLLDVTEKWVQERTLHNAILESIHIMDDSSESKHDKGMIPKILTEALAVSFDPNIGHDYLEQTQDRYDYYHKVEQRVPFDLQMLNKITRGGMPKKTLNVLLGGVNVGKSLCLCHVAAASLAQGYKVLYITLEMAQERIAQRIDANLMNMNMDDVESMSKEDFERKTERLKSHIQGKLIIKEFPTASASSHHFRALLNECRLKRDFKPDLLIIDYINICSSARIKAGSNVNSYTYIKAIAEELRGLAVEHNIPILTATQLTREGFGSSDPDMTDVAESFSLPATADWMIVIVSNEELESNNQLMIKQIKSRYGDVTRDRRFLVGIDRSKMRLYDVDEKAQQSIQGRNPSTETVNSNEDVLKAIQSFEHLKSHKLNLDIKV